MRVTREAKISKNETFSPKTQQNTIPDDKLRTYSYVMRPPSRVY